MEPVFALNLLCVDKVNEQLIAEGINKIDIEFLLVGYRFIIMIGVSGTEDFLIKGLNIYGSSMMAEDFLNSGNEKLENEGKD